MPNPGDQHRDTKASVNPFEEQPTLLSKYSAQEIATLQSRLDKQLGPEYISTRPGNGGGKVHYLAAEKVINLANEVFGFNGWSSSIQNVQVDFVDEAPSTGKVTLGLSSIVRVTLKDGAYHEDIGYGHIENCKGKAAAFEKAKKEAVTDGLKRTLRNFGNVLGNCLYDKDYLAKVTKLKIAPTRWSADNLHRHPDFAPIIKETTLDTDDAVIAKPPRNAAQPPTSMNRTGSVEDEFGGNLFDEMDFSHPDEVHLADTSVVSDTTGVSIAQQAAPRLQPVRMRSMPSIRPDEVARGQAVPQTPGHGQMGKMLPPPANMPRPTTSRGPQHKAEGPTAGGNASTGAHNVRPGGGAATPSNGNVSGIAAGESNNGDAKVDPTASEMVQVPPEVANVGFLAGSTLNKGSFAPFNPHADSPSIRRTCLINGGKSEPIKRSAIAAATGGDSTPSDKSDFVNPAADPNRRIGMPAGRQSPAMNRGAYKPPSNVKRPATGMSEPGRQPLGDLSNVQLNATNGPIDAKRPKLDGAELQSAV